MPRLKYAGCRGRDTVVDAGRVGIDVTCGVVLVVYVKPGHSCRRNDGARNGASCGGVRAVRVCRVLQDQRLEMRSATIRIGRGPCLVCRRRDITFKVLRGAQIPGQVCSLRMLNLLEGRKIEGFDGL